MKVEQTRVIESMSIVGCTMPVGDNGEDIPLPHCWIDQMEARGLSGKGISDPKQFFDSAKSYLASEGVMVDNAQIDKIIYEGEI